jgi:hypothetical protein
MKIQPRPLLFGSEALMPLKEILGRIACTITEPALPLAAAMPWQVQR